MRILLCHPYAFPGWTDSRDWCFLRLYGSVKKHGPSFGSGASLRRRPRAFLCEPSRNVSLFARSPCSKAQPFDEIRSICRLVQFDSTSLWAPAYAPAYAPACHVKLERSHATTVQLISPQVGRCSKSKRCFAYRGRLHQSLITLSDLYDWRDDFKAVELDTGSESYTSTTQWG